MAAAKEKQLQAERFKQMEKELKDNKPTFNRDEMNRSVILGGGWK